MNKTMPELALSIDLGLSCWPGCNNLYLTKSFNKNTYAYLKIITDIFA